MQNGKELLYAPVALISRGGAGHDADAPSPVEFRGPPSSEASDILISRVAEEQVQVKTMLWIH